MNIEVFFLSLEMVIIKIRIKRKMVIVLIVATKKTILLILNFSKRSYYQYIKF